MTEQDELVASFDDVVRQVRVLHDAASAAEGKPARRAENCFRHILENLHELTLDDAGNPIPMPPIPWANR